MARTTLLRLLSKDEKSYQREISKSRIFPLIVRQFPNMAAHIAMRKQRKDTAGVVVYTSTVGEHYLFYLSPLPSCFPKHNHYTSQTLKDDAVGLLA